MPRRSSGLNPGRPDPDRDPIAMCTRLTTELSRAMNDRTCPTYDFLVSQGVARPERLAGARRLRPIVNHAYGLADAHGYTRHKSPGELDRLILQIAVRLLLLALPRHRRRHSLDEPRDNPATARDDPSGHAQRKEHEQLLWRALHQLAESDLKILTLLFLNEDGMKNKKLAKQLGVHPSTLKSHIGQLFAALRGMLREGGYDPED